MGEKVTSLANPNDPQFRISSAERREKFAREYVVDLNATRAAIAAGYRPHSAHVVGSQLLANIKVKKRVNQLLAGRASRLEVKADRVVEELANLAFANMRDYVEITDEGQASINLSRVTREQMAAVQEITVDEYAGGAGDGERRQVVRTKLKLSNKEKSLELLGRHLPEFFKDSRERGGDTNITVLGDLDARIIGILRSGLERAGVGSGLKALEASGETRALSSGSGTTEINVTP